MSPRDRRRFLIAFVLLIVLLFAGGMLAFVLDFRHRTICPGRRSASSRTPTVGQVTYRVPEWQDRDAGHPALAMAGWPSGRDWWLRTLLVLQAPRPVFVALRDDGSDAVSNRSEPVLLVILLAGIAGVLIDRAGRHLMDDRQLRRLARRGVGVHRRRAVRHRRVLAARRDSLRRRQGARLAGDATGGRATCSRSPPYRLRSRSFSGR